MKAPPLDREGIDDWLRQLDLAPGDGWWEVAQGRGFAVDGLTRINQLRAVLLDMNEALADGLTFAQWRKQELKTFPDYRRSLILDGVAQSAYIAGRFQWAMERDLYLRYVTAKDERTCFICAPRDGLIRHASDPNWQGNCPPLHARCRCSLRPVDREQAWLDSREGQGLFQSAPEIMPGEGWGNIPQPLDPGLRDALRDALQGLPDDLRRSADRWLRDGWSALEAAL